MGPLALLGSPKPAGGTEMSEVKKLDCKLYRTGTIGVFHKTREDVRTLAGVLNEHHDKINELIDEIRELRKLIEMPKGGEG